MKVSEQATRELQQIFQRETRQILTEQEAEEMAHDLLRLFSIICRPLPRSQLKKGDYKT